jgi:glycerate 2-kinase
LISAAGANIEQLNIVRQNVSLVKGGGLARACRAGHLITLVISDVLGDPLDMIASGPTVERNSTAADALHVLEDLGLVGEPSISAIVSYLRRRVREESEPQGALEPFQKMPKVTNLIIGNNATAVDGAGIEAERLGYSHAMICATKSEGSAEEVGRHLAGMARAMRDNPGPNCLISGGEPTVKLVDQGQRGKGGRNQQLALAALAELGDADGICLLSGGTDGEDGPTDAAGAVVDTEVVRAASKASLDANDYLARNDAYTFFQKCGGLLITGPTQTNVCDLRVVVVQR